MSSTCLFKYYEMEYIYEYFITLDLENWAQLSKFIMFVLWVSHYTTNKTLNGIRSSIEFCLVMYGYIYIQTIFQVFSNYLSLSLTLTHAYMHIYWQAMFTSDRLIKSLYFIVIVRASLPPFPSSYTLERRINTTYKCNSNEAWR